MFYPNRILLLIWLGTIYYSSIGQNIPVFSQKITDGFLINPALTGASGGSVTTSYLKQWQSVANSPQTTYISAHMLNKADRVGFGINGYFDKTNQLKLTQTSLAASYHMSIASQMRLSFGLSMEMRTSRLDFENIFVKDPDDPVLLNYQGENSIDFSSGINLSHPFFDIGIAAQRLSQLVGNATESTLFNGMITSYFNYYLPLRNDLDLLEPRIIYRKEPGSKSLVEALLFYTINKEFILGLNYRTENILGGSVGYIYHHRYVLGYTVLTGMGEGGRDLGMTHEVAIRFNFNKQYFSNYNPEENEPRNSFTFKKKRIE